MKRMILAATALFCLSYGCSPEKYDVDLSYGLTHGIAKYNGDEQSGTFNFYRFIHFAMIDSGVSYDRPMDMILNATVPGDSRERKYTVFVLQNDDVDQTVNNYFGKPSIQSSFSSPERKQLFKLLQFYYTIGEYKLENMPARMVMDNGFEVTVSGNELTGFDGNKVKIISADNVARNGVFHVIDAPLHPADPASLPDYKKSYFYDYR